MWLACFLTSSFCYVIAKIWRVVKILDRLLQIFKKLALATLKMAQCLYPKRTSLKSIRFILGYPGTFSKTIDRREGPAGGLGRESFAEALDETFVIAMAYPMKS
jgi:hypothetical protein